MLSYLSSEAGFVRAFGNRTLLLIFLCALTRVGVEKADQTAKGSAFGISVDLNPGILAVYGPLLVLLLLIGLRSESDILLNSREAVLTEVSKLPARVRRVNRAIYVLFWTPTVAAIFLVVQYYINVVPYVENMPNPCDYERILQFFDGRYLKGTASIYCLKNIKIGMPWIYIPFQIYVYILIIAACFYLTMKIVKDWPKARG